MKKIAHLLTSMLIATFILTSCISENNKNLKSKQAEEQLEKAMELSEDFFGNYHGIQESYFMKNQYGDDMIIAGNKVPVRSSDFKFLLKENNAASLQQTNLEDNKRYYYDGSYKIISDESDFIKVEISLSDGQGSSPNYILEINKSDKKGNCIGKKEPIIKISKTN
jgi:hypothetical protein